MSPVSDDQRGRLTELFQRELAAARTGAPEETAGRDPIAFTHGGVAYRIVPSTKYPSGFQVELDSGEFVAHIGSLDLGYTPPAAVLIVLAKRAIDQKPNRDFEL